MPLLRNAYGVAEGVQLSFTDSGPPSNSDEYTTLVVLHGLGFGEGSFERLQAHAHEFNMRIVVINRREYGGSTPYTESELEDLRAGNYTRVGLHLGLFLEMFIEEENIPENGGLVIMGWSLGVLTAQSLFSSSDILDKEKYEVLERYIKHLILYDPPTVAMGYALPPEINISKLYYPLLDPKAKTAEERTRLFVEWISSHYDYTLGPSGTPTIQSLEEVGSFHRRTSKCLADSWGPSELEQLLDVRASDPACADHMAVAAYPSVAPGVNNLTFNSLFNSTLARTYFPDVSVVYLYAPHSIWMTVLAYMETLRNHREHVERKEAIRPIQFVTMNGADHFVHYSEPVRFLEVIREATNKV